MGLQLGQLDVAIEQGGPKHGAAPLGSDLAGVRVRVRAGVRVGVRVRVNAG